MRINLFFVICLMFISCNKPPIATKIHSGNGKIMFYSHFFLEVNCMIDSISIFVDDEKVGKLTTNYFPLDRIPAYNDSNILVNSLPNGTHTYKATLYGCKQGYWNGTFTTNNDSLIIHLTSDKLNN